MKYLAILLSLLILSIYMIASAFNETSIVQFENAIMCEPTIPLTFSGADIRITEIGFDGNDERIELTNIGDMDFSGTITVSGVKSLPVSYHFELPSTHSIVFGDTLNSLTGVISMITGQGFSLPDTTGFTLTLAIDPQPSFQYSFSKATISQIPNAFGLESIRSGTDLFRSQTSVVTTFNVISPVVANPGVLFCTQQPIDIFEEPIYTGTDELPNEFSGAIFTGGDVDLSGDIEPLDTGDILPEVQDPPIEENVPPETPFIPTQLPCVISEIHPTIDTYSEYVELLCTTPFSGTIKTIGIGVGETNKDVSIFTNGGYWIVSSSTGFSTSFDTTLITSMSLRDGGETITLSLSGFYTGFVTFPEIPSGKSFYPLCGTTGCIGLSSPGFNELYLSGFVIGPISFPSPPTTTSSTSTYYQDLYNKRKSTAESYKTENSALKKEQTRINKELTTLQKKSQTVSATKKTTSTTTSKPSTTKVTASKAATTAKITTSTKKAPTVSTTSKAYIKLVDEHKLYKNYISFVDSYLKSRLYTQYSALGLSKVQSLLSNSLKAIGKQNYIISLSGSTTGISVFDFNQQLGQKPLTLDTLYISLFYHYSSFFSSVSNSLSGIFLAKDVSKDTLIEGKNLSKNDTGNDIMGTKISEMSFLRLE